MSSSVLFRRVEPLILGTRQQLCHDLSLLSETMTPAQNLAIVEHRLALYQRIKMFRQMQQHIASYSDAINDISVPHPELWPLLLPSSLSSHSPPPGSVLEQLATIESRLRFAQATDSLEDIRHSLCVRSQLTNYKRAQVRGQCPNTRANALLQNVEKKLHSNASRYRCARIAYMVLLPQFDIGELRPLEEGDIRGLGEDQTFQPCERLGEGHRTVSWIWMQNGSMTGSELNEGESNQLVIAQFNKWIGLRAEWAKARA